MTTGQIVYSIVTTVVMVPWTYYYLTMTRGTETQEHTS